MSTLKFTKPEPARAPTLEDHETYTRVRDEMVQANRTLTKLEGRWRQLEEAKTSSDVVGRLDARAEQPKLLEEIAHAEAAVARARSVYAAGRIEAQAPVTRWYVAEVKQAASGLLTALRRVRDAEWRAVERAIEAARSAGVPASSLPLRELSFEIFVEMPHHNYFDENARRLERWLEE